MLQTTNHVLNCPTRTEFVFPVLPHQVPDGQALGGCLELLKHGRLVHEKLGGHETKPRGISKRISTRWKVNQRHWDVGMAMLWIVKIQAPPDGMDRTILCIHSGA